jgi:predicted PurR-regulated permease PerM
LIPLTILSWLAVSITILWLLGHVAVTLIMLAFSGIIAFALAPLVSCFSRWLPRGIATTLAYVLGFAVIAGLGAIIATSASNEITTLVHNLPSYQRRLQSTEPRILHLLGPFGGTRAGLHRAEHEAIAYLHGVGTSVARDSVTIASQILSTLVQLVLTLILSIYLISNGPAWPPGSGARRPTPIDDRSCGC